jgi:terminase large subunit-like protein
VRAGRRGGKTTGAATLAVEQFLKGRRVLYAVPTTEQINKFWAEVKRALAEPLGFGVYYKNETEHRIEVVGSDQRIRAKTAWNADTLRGDYADLLILDEWQLMDEDAWEEVGAPMLIDNNGNAVFIYTPPSLHSKSVTKARDPRHASKMYEKGKADTSGRWLAIHFTSHDNPHVSEEGIAEITLDMTQLAYRQEILAEDIDEVPGALWTQKLLDETRVSQAPELRRIVVGIDPSGSSTNEAGVVAGGLGLDGHAYLLEDESLLAAAPRSWASNAVHLYYKLKADRIVGERNYGGDMVESTVRTVDPNVSYKDVNATRGKLVRAEPICAMYEKHMVHHVGNFPRLEEEMCSYVPGNPSPNRMDAAVWVLTELLEGGNGLLDLMKEQAEAIKSRQSTTLNRDPGTPEEQFRVQASAQMEQAKKADFKIAGVFGAPVNKVASSSVPKPKVVASTPRCPKCQNVNVTRSRTAGLSGDIEEKCGACGWSQILPGI